MKYALIHNSTCILVVTGASWLVEDGMWVTLPDNTSVIPGWTYSTETSTLSAPINLYVEFLKDVQTLISRNNVAPLTAFITNMDSLSALRANLDTEAE